MVRRSRGLISKRSRLVRKKRKEKSMGLSKRLKSFKKGQTVRLDLKAGESGMPHPRYRGRSGVIVGKQGKAYVVEVSDGMCVKKLAIPGVHLR